MNDFDLRLLKVFATVVECRGFAGAQAQLNVSQSTVSTQMSALEQRLGIRLCQRGRIGFRLTDQGQAIYEATKRLLAAVDSFQLEAGEARGRLSGTLRIGIIDNTITTPNVPLQDAIERFDRRDHEVHFDLTIAEPHQLERGVLDGKLHLAIGPFGRRIEGLAYRPLYEERHAVFCGRNHRLFAQADSALSDSEITDAKFAARSYMDGADIRKVGARRPAAFVSNVEAQAMLLLSGDFIGYLPEHYAAQWVEKGLLRPILRHGLEYFSPFSLITRRGVPESRVQEAFIEDLLALLEADAVR